VHNRILDLSEEPVGLSSRLDNLVLRREQQPQVAIPFESIAVVVASNPRVHASLAALSDLAAKGGVFIACDGARLPVAMMLPLHGNSTQTERISNQIEASLPIKKRTWQQIVRVKIRAQADTLQAIHGDDHGLFALAERVRSGDPQNLEAQAARRYWPLLFAGSGFVRDRDARDVNQLLNYGYAVLRAIVARAVCAAGLHPSVGIHHHNRYSAFTLADDLMEPLRVIVDRESYAILSTRKEEVSLDREVKAQLIGAMTKRFLYQEDARTLFDIVARIASSLNDVYAGSSRGLALPSFPGFFPPRDGEE
jgi:CRISPR-associated protein Cas1